MAEMNIPIEDNLPPGPTDIGLYVSNIIGVALIVAAVATFAYLVMAGISWISAGGDAKKIEEARNRITGAIVGLAIVATSWALFLILDYFFGLGVAQK